MAKTRDRNPKLPRAATLKLLIKISEELREIGIPFARLILFGSHAKGYTGPNSDIDICLLFSSRMSLDEVAKHKSKADMHLSYHKQLPVDVLAYRLGDFNKDRLSPIIHEIKTYGIEILGSKALPLRGTE